MTNTTTPCKETSMRSRMLLAALALAVAATPTIAVVSTAQAGGEASKVRASKYRMLFTFEYGETLRPNTYVRDASRHKNRGLVLTQSRGKLRVAKGVKRHGADFPNRCPGCGRALLEVKDRAGLDPGSRRFVFGAAVRLTAAQGRFGSNVFQKGYFKTAGGQFKLQVNPGGIPVCVFNGHLGRLIVTSSVGIANRKWQHVSCLRGAHGVQIRVTGKLRGSVAGKVGMISNASPIRIGAKKIAAPNKQFPGVLDNVYLRFLPRLQ
jgi:hypothetical protein